jgi:hypothetical protein
VSIGDRTTLQADRSRSVEVAPSDNDKPIHLQERAGFGQAVKKMNVGSWAAVAATPTGDGNRVVKFRPSDALKRHAVEDTTPLDPSLMRVVWVKNWDTSKRPLSSLTECIDQGPLLSMAHSERDNAVCIIFMHAHHAQSFLQASGSTAGRTGHRSLGSEVEVLEGQPYPNDDAIQRMESPWNERRRLTFARQKLFAEGTTEEQFKKDIFAIVGEQNVELVWLFNSGNGKQWPSPVPKLCEQRWPTRLNIFGQLMPAGPSLTRITATVVFSATAIARMVRDEFRRKARQAGPYRDVQVTFSHDPCERPLNLITQIPSSRSGARPGNGSNISHNFPRPSGPASPHRRPSVSRVDEDGWQTVARRK